MIYLGQRVYRHYGGYVESTLVTSIEIPSRESRTTYQFGSSDVPEVNCEFLDQRFTTVYLTFDEAYDAAISWLREKIKDRSISVAASEAFTQTLTKMQTDRHKEDLRRIVEAVTSFSKIGGHTLLSRLDWGNKGPFTQDDFPQRYKEPGTLVWIAYTKNWKIVHHPVTKVTFDPRRKSRLSYDCGPYSALLAQQVFLTKKGAMNYLEKKFTEELPGTLVRKRVEVIGWPKKSDKIPLNQKQAVARYMSNNLQLPRYRPT